MARLEPNTIIASSLDNFLIFDNQYYTLLPNANVSILNSAVGQNITLTFEDADDPDAAKIILEGKPNVNITSRTFNTSGSTTQLMFSLIECLKMNSIVYDVYKYSILDSGKDRNGFDVNRETHREKKKCCK